MKSLASQSSSGTVTDSRAYLNSKSPHCPTRSTAWRPALAIATRACSTEPSIAAGATVLVGSSSADTITVTLDDLTATTLGVDTLDISTQTVKYAEIDALDIAIDLGGTCSDRAPRSSASTSAQVRSRPDQQNLQAANSAILDVDIAAEQAKLSSAQVKVQAADDGQILADQMPQYLLKLL